MSDTSGPSLPVPFGFYDPESRSLKTSRTTFDSASTLSSATLPTSGSMRSGSLYARTRSALPTSAAGSSSSPQLPTPTARDWKGEGYDGQLPNAVALLPTPTTSEATGIGHAADCGMNLRHTVSLLPTPKATQYGSNQSPSSGAALRPSLSQLAPTLLPTPVVADSTDTANFRPDGTPYSEGYGMTLLDATRLLLPTPTAADGERTSETYSRGNPTLLGAVSRPPSRGGKRSPAAVPPGQLTIDTA